MNNPPTPPTDLLTLMNSNHQPLALETTPPIARPGDYLSRLNYSSPGNVQHIPIKAAPNNFADERLSVGSPDFPIVSSGEHAHDSDDLLPENVQDQGEVCSSSQFYPEFRVIEGFMTLFALGIIVRAALHHHRDRDFDLTGWILNQLLFMFSFVIIFCFFWNLGAKCIGKSSPSNEL